MPRSWRRASLSLITARIPEGPPFRTKALGLYGATASIGYVVGQVLGGCARAVHELALQSSWSMFPSAWRQALLAPRLLSPDERSVRTSRLDMRGGLLITLGVALAVFGISEARFSGGCSLS